MSNSQDQSLDENAVFLPVDESSPVFLYCEREREAVERLLIAGPEAFYSYVGNKRSGCFLSPGEVSQISSWAQSYHFNHQQGQAENGVESSSEMEDFCSTYFPQQSDMPTPALELGWPERGPWVLKGKAMVYTSPPAEGEPPVREVIRQHLQKASQVIAIVTDRLTDGAIIGDLHTAASRGIPIYIILNQRSIQENFTLNRLRHPNMRVRVLGGKTFCTRTGQMVVGEMKDQFLLVDLETVIHGSYSLTWTDAHLHRQLITVLTGPVVDSFDREFRILYAASIHVPDTWRAAGSDGNASRQLKDNSDSRLPKTLSLEPEITSPPSPPADFLLDWEAMGVVHNDCNSPKSPLNQHEEILFQETQLPSNKPFDRNTNIKDGLTNNGNAPFERKRTHLLSYRIERNIEQAIMRQLSNEKQQNSHEAHPARFDDKEQTRVLSPTKRRTRRRASDRESSSENSLKVENHTSSRVSNTPFAINKYSSELPGRN
uniref:Protein FAM83E-like n=1 Tax=Gouania willdenowi TaxID=441366 RepID=A0A8C5HLS3_GOUWI